MQLVENVVEFTNLFRGEVIVIFCKVLNVLLNEALDFLGGEGLSKWSNTVLDLITIVDGNTCEWFSFVLGLAGSINKVARRMKINPRVDASEHVF